MNYQPDFLPQKDVDMSGVRDLEYDQQELAKAETKLDIEDYIEQCNEEPNTGFVIWHTKQDFLDTLQWLSENLPLSVPTRVLVDNEDGKKTINSLTRYEDLKLGPNTQVTELEHVTASMHFGGEFVQVGAIHEYWHTLSTATGNDDTKCVSNLLEGDPNVNPSCIMMTDLINVCLRKRRAVVQEQLHMMVIAELRPNTTALGVASRTNPLFEPRLYDLIGSFLL
jgi:hypothetical protein